VKRKVVAIVEGGRGEGTLDGLLYITLPSRLQIVSLQFGEMLTLPHKLVFNDKVLEGHDFMLILVQHLVDLQTAQPPFRLKFQQAAHYFFELPAVHYLGPLDFRVKLELLPVLHHFVELDDVDLILFVVVEGGGSGDGPCRQHRHPNCERL
jgi:hypothetical protein